MCGSQGTCLKEAEIFSIPRHRGLAIWALRNQDGLGWRQVTLNHLNRPWRLAGIAYQFVQMSLRGGYLHWFGLGKGQPDALIVAQFAIVQVGPQ